MTSRAFWCALAGFTLNAVVWTIVLIKSLQGPY